MVKVIKIRYKNRVLAIILRSSFSVKKLAFLNSIDDLFQLGIHQRKKGETFTPHLHIPPKKPFIINKISEFLYIKKGKIKIDLYSPTKRKVKTFILKTGDSILFLEGGHGIKILEDAKIIELKQGPYPGREKAKEYFSPLNRPI